MQIYLERIDPAQNMARYYLVDVSRDLFGMWMVTRQWGRIGSGGQRRVAAFDDKAKAIQELEIWRRSKTRRGYHLQ